MSLVHSLGLATSDNYTKVKLFFQQFTNNLHCNLATRQYSWGNDIKIVSGIYTNVAFQTNWPNLHHDNPASNKWYEIECV